MAMNPKEDECFKEKDRISQLPDTIIHEILGFLPIRSAARTIILSHRWKNVFSSIPDLNFTSIDSSTQTRRMLHYKAESPEDINFIINVLFLRDMNLCIRTLKLKSFHSTIFNCLIKYPNFIDVQNLDMMVTIQDDLYIPWDIINCGYLKVLSLNILCFNYKHILPLPMNIDFKLLHTLNLSKLSFLIFFNDSPTLLNLFTDSLFPCLNKLTLDSCYGVTELNLRCSMLTDLLIKDCCLQKLNIYGLNLETLKVERCFDDTIDKKVTVVAPVIKLLKWILSINDVKFISKVKFESLRTLQICIEYYPFNNYNNFSEIAILFKNSPYLETLIVTINTFYKDDTILFSDSSDYKDWQDQGLEMNYSLYHLRTVKLDRFLECDKHIDLAKFLLKHGKVLENMIVCLGPLDNDIQLVCQRRIESMLMGFFRASSKVKIVFQ
ncbi:putative F-box/FBD/LRR-repeat protein At4g03220 [Impatiens glandulifera]|uniref:putative F-box/FBD/LRR-repeat protein At4g03220 n=1 Tax=Impatiens glandulifera TaxID=253017 RepID=UPI001FB1388A|nr:putative F-box/FBD/LRR-repeat protein At4g03220 [Impatiens glandulifera]